MNTYIHTFTELLFVKYLDGLYLFDLQKHFDEVAGYYARFSRYSDDRVEDTIRKLLDPMGEEVRNTNLTRIKKAFLDKVSDNWAQYYYVDGPRGEKKSIMLDRSLIEVETNL